MTSSSSPAPVFSSGGGGFEYADHVAAFVMAAMMAGQPPFGEDIGLVTRLDWETSGSGWKFDDLLLTCDSSEARQVAVSCKAGAYVTSGGWALDAAKRLWEQWTGPPPNPFRRGVDRLALVTGTLAQGVGQAWDRLLQEALATDPARFIERFNTPRTTGEVGRELVASLACPRPLLARVGDEPIERTQLLKHVRLWHKDLQRLDSNDTSQAVEWCRQSLADGSRETAQMLHQDIRSLAADRRIRGGTLDLQGLVRELIHKFGFKTWPNHEADWHVLDARSDERANAVGDTVNDELCLIRTDVMAKLIAESTPGHVVLVEGQSGSGKSALVKRLSHGFARTLWLHASDLEGMMLRDIGRSWGLNAPLTALVGEERMSRGLLVIDGAERLTVIGRRNAAQLIASAVNAPLPWVVIATTQEESSERLALELDRGMPTRTLASVYVSLPDEQTIRSLEGTLPIELAADASRSVVRALRNLKVLDWTVRSSSRTELRRYPELIERVWDGFIGEADPAARSQVLKAISKADAEVVVGGVARSYFSGVAEQRVIQGLISDGLLTLRNERLFLRHDLLGDWARLLLLVEAGEDVDELLGNVISNIRWAPAIRLFAEWLSQNGGQARRHLGRLLTRGENVETDASLTLLEGLLRSPDGGETLKESLPGLLIAGSGIVAGVLRTFVAVATRPSAMSHMFARDDPAGVAVRATFRVPIPELWPGMIATLEANSAAVAGVVPVELADVARVWLGDQSVAFHPTFAPTSVGCSQLALSAARETQARIAEGERGHKSSYTGVFEAMLLAAPWLPEDVAQVSLQMAARRPDSPEVVARVEAEKRRVAAMVAQRMAQVSNKALMAGRRQLSIGPTFKPKRKAFEAGPIHRVDEAFRAAVLKPGAVVRLALHKPEVAQEVLLACCLSDPSQDDPLYSDLLHSNRAGTVDKFDWFPPLYLRGPWLPLLLQVPKEGLTAIVRLVDVATEEWLRLCISPVGAKGHEIAEQRSTITLKVNGQSRTFRGGSEVFGWYRGYGQAGNVVPSALMALEEWLYRRLDAQQSVDEVVEQILRTGSSVALLGVLAALARKEPTLLRGCLGPLLTSWMLLNWDDRLSIQSTLPDFDPFNLQALNGWIEKESERWKKLPHRPNRLQWQVAAALALGDQELIELCAATRTAWQAEIDAGECLDHDEAGRLIALLDPSNLTATDLGEGEVQIDVKWPDHLAARYAELGERSNPELIAFHLRSAMRTTLDDGTPLQDEQAESIWRVVSELDVTDISMKDEEDTDSPIVARAAAAAVLESLAATWLDRFPVRRAWCEDAVMKAAVGSPRRPSVAYGLSIYKEHTEAFVGEWALARLASGDGRAEVRRMLAEAMTANEYIVAGQVLASAVRQAAKLTDELGRLFNVLWLWVALRNLTPPWQHDHANGQMIFDGRRSRLIQAFVNTGIPNSVIPWDVLRLRAARRYARSSQTRSKDRLRSSRSEEHDAVSATERCPLPAAWKEYDNHGFNWSVLERVITQLPVVIRPSLEPGLGPLIEFDQRLVDLVEFTIIKANSDDAWKESCPNQFDFLALRRVCMLIAGHEEEQTAADIWMRLAPLLPRRPSWCEAFFDQWFSQPREDTARIKQFHSRWRMMITSALASREWGEGRTARSYDRDNAWSALLGVHTDSSGLGLEVDRPYLRSLVKIYQQWAERCLASRWRLRVFCTFLQQPGAADLRIPALPWIDCALKKLAPYLPSESELVTEVVGYCFVVWYEHWESVLAAASPRTALLSVVQRFSQLRVDAIHELKADLEQTIAGLGESV